MLQMWIERMQLEWLHFTTFDDYCDFLYGNSWQFSHLKQTAIDSPF